MKNPTIFPEAAKELAQKIPALPELCIVSAYGADHPLIRSFAAQCVERGIFFAAGEDDSLGTDVPADLGGFKAVVLDQPAMEAASREADVVNRLNRFSEQGGSVYRLEDTFRAPPPMNLNPQAICDELTAGRVEDIILHATLTRNHPAMTGRQLARDPFALLPGMRESVLGHLNFTRLSESTQHWWKAAAWFCEDGDPEMAEALAANVRQLPEWDGPPLRSQDEVAGGSAAAWLVDQTGETAPFEALRKRLDWLIEHGNRIDGVLKSGIAGNALGFTAGKASEADFGRVIFGARRRVSWTEALHRYGSCFASVYRITGEAKYLDEALRWVEHLRRWHLREDGLLAHCARDGGPATDAWSRGQNHALYGLLYVMEEIGSEHAGFDPVRRLLETVLRALARFQDRETGLWRNIIDHPDARVESSGTCAFACILARCLNRGWLAGEEFAPVLERAWQGLIRMLWRGGLSAHCRGTAAGDTNYYLARPQGWSPAPLFVLAVLEMKRRRAAAFGCNQSS